MQDISAFRSRIQLIASNTFPVGINLTEFSDDVDAFDLASIQIGDKAMGINGDLVKWSKATPIPLVISVIPGSTDDYNLSYLFNANRVGKGKLGAADIITVTIYYPNLNIVTLNNGIITDGMPGMSAANTGRLKTKTYNFAFENMNFNF